MYLYTGSLFKLFQFLTFIINQKQATKIATGWVTAYPIWVCSQTHSYHFPKIFRHIYRIFEHFPNISQDFTKAAKDFRKLFHNVPKDIRSFPKFLSKSSSRMTAPIRI